MFSEAALEGVFKLIMTLNDIIFTLSKTDIQRHPLILVPLLSCWPQVLALFPLLSHLSLIRVTVLALLFLQKVYEIILQLNYEKG